MSEVSNCCRADIHYGHCTKCEKPCRVYRGTITNDPEQKHGEREPMLTEDMIDMGCDPSETVNGLYPESHGKSGALWSRDFYESLITDGTLIKKDELVGWLIEHRYSDFRPYPQAVTIIIDHLNKKP